MLALATASLLFAPLAAPPQQPNNCARTVAGRAVTVRSFFKDTMPAVAELAPSTPVKIVEERAPWSRVQVPGGLLVYVHQNYLTREGETGTINASNVRARPLPSDAPESYPVGLFVKGDKVQVLGMNGPWYQVVAPESLSGWVESKDLQPIGAPPSSWEQEWAAARTTRTSLMARQAAVAPPGAQAPASAPATAPAPAAAAAAAAAAGESRSSSALLGDPVPAGASAGSSEKPVDPLGGLDPVAALHQAEVDMNQAIAAGRYDAAELDHLAGVFAAVPTRTSDALLVTRAQDNQTRLAAYREGKELERSLQARQQELNAEADDAEAAAARKAKVPRPTPAVLETYTLTGWVAHKPAVYSAVPYVVSSGAGEVPVLAVGSRYDFADYVGREVAVRGSYRPSTAPGVRVLEITELRVLPVR